MDVATGRTWTEERQELVGDRERECAAKRYAHLYEYDGLAKYLWGLDRVFRLDDGSFILADDYCNYTGADGVRRSKVFGTFDKTKPLSVPRIDGAFPTADETDRAFRRMAAVLRGEFSSGGPVTLKEPGLVGEKTVGFDLPYHEKFGGRVSYAGTKTGRLKTTGGLDAHIPSPAIDVVRDGKIEHLELNPTPEQAKAICERFFAAYPALVRFQDAQRRARADLTRMVRPPTLDANGIPLWPIVGWDLGGNDETTLSFYKDGKMTHVTDMPAPVVERKEEAGFRLTAFHMDEKGNHYTITLPGPMATSYGAQTTDYSATITDEEFAKAGVSNNLTERTEYVTAQARLEWSMRDIFKAFVRSYPEVIADKVIRIHDDLFIWYDRNGSLGGACDNRDEAVGRAGGFTNDQVAALNAGRNEEVHKKLKAAADTLKIIAEWKDESFPSTGQFYESGAPVLYRAAKGSNGERDYMRALANNTLRRIAGAPEVKMNIRGPGLTREDAAPAAMPDAIEMAFEIVRDLCYAMDDGEERDEPVAHETKPGVDVMQTERIYVVTDDHWDTLTVHLDTLDRMDVTDPDHPGDLLGAAAKLKVLLQAQAPVKDRFAQYRGRDINDLMDAFSVMDTDIMNDGWSDGPESDRQGSSLMFGYFNRTDVNDKQPQHFPHPVGMYAVMDDSGIISYHTQEGDAFIFRMALINLCLNGLG